MHEIVTVQCGQKSNYLATHFWNTQESYFTYSENEESVVDHDVHFRPGIGADGHETFTPRTVIYDLKGGFGTLRKFNALYENREETAPVQGLWDGTLARQHETPIAPTDYQRKLELGLPTSQLHDSDVRFWSDFNRVFYHPKSIVQLNEYELNSQLMPFNDWSAGEELFQNLDREFDVLDRDIRTFAEECDHMQGFQLFSGVDDAWGGFVAKYLDNLRDEFGKTSIWVWGLEDCTTVVRERRLARACNSAQSLRAISQQASAYIRLAAPPTPLPAYINLLNGSAWRTSALLCAGLETITLPTRLRPDAHKRSSLSLLEDTLNTSGNQNLFELQATAGHLTSQTNRHRNGAIHESNGRIISGQDEASDLQPEPSRFDITYMPGVHGESPAAKKSLHIFAQVESERGSGYDKSSPSLTPEERLRRRLNEESVVERFQSDIRFPLLDTFPHDLVEANRLDLDGLDFSAALASSSAMKDRALGLRDTTIRLMPLTERENHYNELTQISSYYANGWDSEVEGDYDDE
ncbi:mtDNA inheritance, partitioning of the mitochondrial organelle [Elasticomyces elasticus]|uniref:Protein DML1 n=1 Tax=Exophiala sideris TaxID=1016849 RepID=A0ABR0JGY3_9EURO|nr:mtDNA inheritance, partitioning of the mitochondrial organelle [Elasticomyces elasticus]KAK5033427.1 mtDNA inheritance, partitioning of the mitochondrial organelle [Exophiala sideris]KAK5042077.1 mtDNA inheritance, partitioning of the mitochondrial organelle [Exophiala sideris]KAK5063971.1 mtDNA inheritance, partitioning of the mitochondrial organelle [Exophiala sideris]KAK5185345.1 mtDNA inheritance, partitioning of the mitochondrial organelle [Eurotiomycetes sp. CCFEE 6388]